MTQFLSEEFEEIAKAISDASAGKEDKTVASISKLALSELEADASSKGNSKERQTKLKKLRTKLEVVFGQKMIPLEQLAKLGKGDLLPFEEEENAPLKIYAEGKHVADGELVAVDEHFGVKITNLH